MSLLHGLHGSRHAFAADLKPSGVTSASACSHVPRHIPLVHCQAQRTEPGQLQPQQLKQRQAAAVGRLHAAAAEERAVSYEWSWQQKGRSHLPEADSQFDQQHPMPAQANLQDLIALLSSAAAACEAQAAAADAAYTAADADSWTPADAPEAAAAAPPPTCLPSQAWFVQLLTTMQPLLQQSPPSGACEVLQLLSHCDYTPDSSWLQQLLTSLCSRLADVSTQQLAQLVWSLSNLRYTPNPQQWQAILTSAQGRLDEFYGPDLALMVCGAGSILSSTSSSFDPEGGVRLQPASGADGAAAASAPSSSGSSQLAVPAGFADAVLAEVQYQVTEFPADLSAFDLARIASGLADLSITPSTGLQDRLMKAVYMRTRTIEEKGAVDFALAKLDAKGKKSMHYDPRWTHEELKWLPRRERDKRRLIKEGWYRTQWTGF